MVEKTTVAVKVSEETKEEWEAYTDESQQVENLSQLIRFSVGREIQGIHEQEGTTESPQIERVVKQMRELKEGFGKVENRLSGLQSRVGAVEEEIKASGPGQDLQRAVFKQLPTWKEAPEGADYDDWAATTEELAESVAGDVEEVQEALDTLSKTTSQVHAVSRDVGTFYFKRE